MNLLELLIIPTALAMGWFAVNLWRTHLNLFAKIAIILAPLFSFIIARAFYTGKPLDSLGPENHFELLIMLALMVAFSILGSISSVFATETTGEASTFKKIITPILCTPLTILPLLPSLNQLSVDNGLLDEIMWVFLSFQNGFFWRKVVDKIKADI